MMGATATSRDDAPRTTSFGSLLFWSGIDLCEEVLLPEQLHPPIRFQPKHRGHVALLYAILSDAIRCFLEGKGAQTPDCGRAAREAEAWLFIDDKEWPFSFVNICEFLGLDPTYVRRGLKGWQSSSTATSASTICTPLQNLFDNGCDPSELLPPTPRFGKQEHAVLPHWVKQRQVVRSLTRR